MINQKDNAPHKFILFFLLLYFCGSFLLNFISWGKYVYIFAFIGVVLCSASQNEYKIKLYRGGFFNYLLIFTAYCFASIIWATDSNMAFNSCPTILAISFCTYLLMCSLKNVVPIEDVLNIIMYSGYIEALYLFSSFGFSALLFGGKRLSNELGNSNFISFLMSVSFLITTNSIITYKKFRFSHLGAILTLSILAIGQSRTALLGAVFGFLVLLICKAFRSDKVERIIPKIVLYLCLGILIVFIMSKIPIFGDVLQRMHNLVVAFTGRGEITDGEGSVIIRQVMINAGLDCFRQHPILGIGIGNSNLIVKNALGYETYLHNNFVEILATLGIIGFCIYYSIYVISFFSLLKYKKYRNKEYDVILALLLMILLMDYGTVSYYAKHTFFYFMLFYLEIQELKKSSVNGCCISEK